MNKHTSLFTVPKDLAMRSPWPTTRAFEACAPGSQLPETMLRFCRRARSDKAFDACAPGLHQAIDAILRPPCPATFDSLQLPATLPPHGIGEEQTLQLLAPAVLGGARRLDATHAFAHMDPPTPWISWATTLWNASLNQNLLHPELAPIASDVEAQVVKWLAPEFGMDGGHMTPGSTVSNVTALWAAREICGIRRVVASDGAHISIRKAANILGLSLTLLPADRATGELSAATLRAAEPLSDAALVLTAGTTAVGAIDDLSFAGQAAWTHVDAAWAGPLRLSPTHRHLLEGIDGADSVSISAHKWLFQPKDSALVLFKATAEAHSALSYGGGYLAKPNVGLLGSRGANAVPLLATLLSWGRVGLVERLDHSMAAIGQLWRRLDAHPGALCFAQPATGVLLWRPHEPKRADELIHRLPGGAASLATADGQRWLRHVAANPMVDLDGLWETIRRTLP